MVHCRLIDLVTALCQSWEVFEVFLIMKLSIHSHNSVTTQLIFMELAIPMYQQLKRAKFNMYQLRDDLVMTMKSSACLLLQRVFY